MARFGYVAYDAEGRPQTGTVAATSRDQASNTLIRRGLNVVELKQKRFSLDMRINLRKSLRPRDLAAMVRNLANTQVSGVPTFRAVTMLSEQFRGTPVGDVLAAVETDVANGSTLGEAFRNREDKIGPLPCAMIEAGETTGQLDSALLRLATILESQARLRRKVIAAASYPLFVMVIAIGVFLGMMLFVVPIFEEIYNDLDADLPALTDGLLTLTRATTRFIYVVPVVLGLLVMGYWRITKIREVRLQMDRLLLRVPLLGPIMRASNMSRVMATVASTLGAGVPLLNGLTVGANVAGNLAFSEALTRVREKVRDGRALHAALAEEDVFPPLLSRVVETGEETGSLASMLERYADVVADETETTVENMTTLIEPVLLVVVGGMVALMLAALYLPLFSLSTAI